MVYDETHGLLDSPRRPEQVKLVEGAAEAMKALAAAGFTIVVATNQPGIAKGTLTPDELKSVNDRLLSLLQERGARWDALYYCPHHPTEGENPELTCLCNCRKPEPGMLLRAAADLDIDLSLSWMIGDGIVDIQAGHAAGCRTALLSSLKIEQIERFISLNTVPDNISKDFATLIRVIL